jgi:hypothetical protein
MWWFLFGVVVGAALWGLILQIRSKRVHVNWYEYLMGLLAVAIFLLLIQHFTGSRLELEPTASWMGALFMGVPGLILAVLAVRLPLQRRSRSRF